jgi:hypothetical protein
MLAKLLLMELNKQIEAIAKRPIKELKGEDKAPLNPKPTSK